MHLIRNVYGCLPYGRFFNNFKKWMSEKVHAHVGYVMIMKVKWSKKIVPCRRIGEIALLVSIGYRTSPGSFQPTDGF